MFLFLPCVYSESAGPGHLCGQAPHAASGGPSPRSRRRGQSLAAVRVTVTPTSTSVPHAQGDSVSMYQWPTVNSAPECGSPGASVPVTPSVSLPGESIKAVRFPGVGKSHTQAGHERRVQDHGSTLVPRGQVHCGHRPNALAVQDDVLRTHPVPAQIRGGLLSATGRGTDRGTRTAASATWASSKAHHLMCTV